MNNKLELSDSMILPETSYGPFCNRIMQEFIEYHHLPDLPLPGPCLPPHIILSRIYDAMLLSMGQEKRNELLIELEEYKKGL